VCVRLSVQHEVHIPYNMHIFVYTETEFKVNLHMQIRKESIWEVCELVAYRSTFSTAALTACSITSEISQNMQSQPFTK
jgi:hypothetical protein